MIIIMIIITKLLVILDLWLGIIGFEQHKACKKT